MSISNVNSFLNQQSKQNNKSLTISDQSEIKNIPQKDIFSLNSETKNLVKNGRIREKLKPFIEEIKNVKSHTGKTGAELKEQLKSEADAKAEYKSSWPSMGAGSTAAKAVVDIMGPQRALAWRDKLAKALGTDAVKRFDGMTPRLRQGIGWSVGKG